MSVHTQIRRANFAAAAAVGWWANDERPGPTWLSAFQKNPVKERRHNNNTYNRITQDGGKEPEGLYGRTHRYLRRERNNIGHACSASKDGAKEESSERNDAVLVERLPRHSTAKNVLFQKATVLLNITSKATVRFPRQPSMSDERPARALGHMPKNSRD